MGHADTPVLSCPNCLLGFLRTFPMSAGWWGNSSCQTVVVGRAWCLTSGSDQTLALLRWATGRALTLKHASDYWLTCCGRRGLWLHGWNSKVRMTWTSWVCLVTSGSDSSFTAKQTCDLWATVILFLGHIPPFLFPKNILLEVPSERSLDVTGE